MPSQVDEDAPYALVVDDEFLILEVACDILGSAGFRPLRATSVAQAIGWFEIHGEDIAVLFTDVQMPGGRNGFSLAREAARRWPGVSILVASGMLEPGPGELPESAVFIRKPFEASLVYDRLAALLPDGVRPAPLQRRVD